MLHVDLTPDAQHLVQIDPLRVFGRCVLPAGAPQAVVKLVEEHLDVMGDAATQAPAHVLADLRRKPDVVGLGERRQAGRGGFLAPGFQVVGGIYVGVSAEPGLLQERFESYAARQDHRDSASMRLPVPAQPAQELVGRAPSLRRGQPGVVLEQPVDEDRQFVDGADDGPVAHGQSREYRIASLRPVSCIDSRAQFHLDVRESQFLESFAYVLQYVRETILDSIPGALQRPRLYPDLGNRVGRVHCSLQIDENRLEFAGIRQPLQQLPHEARLAHAPLRRQQGVGSVSNAFFERFELGLPIEEPVAIDPVASALCKHRQFPNRFIGNNIVGNKSAVRSACHSLVSLRYLPALPDGPAVASSPSGEGCRCGRPGHIRSRRNRRRGDTQQGGALRYAPDPIRS